MFSIWTSSSQNKTHGITIIEVLTAMVVAMIGVFGVMALIPFAVKQAETGLDLDDAFRVARNGIAQFEIYGHNRLINGQVPWSFNEDGDRVPAPDVFSIDPLSIFGNPLPPMTSDPFGQFPPASSIPVVYANFPYIQEVNVGTYNPIPTPTYTPLNAATARNMFVSTDDLSFGDPVDELSPPPPYYDQYYNSDSSISPIGYRNAARQFRGEMSWSAIVVPEKDDYVSIEPNQGMGGSGGWKFRMHTLVYKNRVILHTPAGGVGTMVMPVAEVVGPVTSGGNTSADYVDPMLGPPNPEIVVGTGTTITLDKPNGNVQKNDWLMLINEDEDLELGFRKQVGFFRVIGTGTNPLDPLQGTITIDGPDFSFRTETETMPREHIKTYVVLLVNFDPSLTQRPGSSDQRIRADI